MRKKLKVDFNTIFGVSKLIVHKLAYELSIYAGEIKILRDPTSAKDKFK